MGRILKGSIGVVFSSSRDRPRGSRPHRGSHAAEAQAPSAPLSLPLPTVPPCCRTRMFLLKQTRIILIFIIMKLRHHFNILMLPYIVLKIRFTMIS